MRLPAFPQYKWTAFMTLAHDAYGIVGAIWLVFIAVSQCWSLVDSIRSQSSATTLAGLHWCIRFISAHSFLGGT